MSATNNPPNDDSVIENMVRDLIAADQDFGKLQIEVGRVEMFCVIAAVQLACRHPGYTGPSRELVEKVMRQISLALPASTHAMIEKGWDPRYDITVSA